MNSRRKTKENILKRVEKDLNPSLFRVVCYLLLSFGVGGVFSMFVCGQFGIGLSSFALHMSHKLHSQMNPSVCSILCGGIFAIVPVFILKLIAHPIFFAVIVKKYYFLQAGFIFFFGLIVYSHSNYKLELASLFLWSLSAYLVFKILSGLILCYVTFQNQVRT